jgi:hypothetical protein
MCWNYRMNRMTLNIKRIKVLFFMSFVLVN